MATFLGLAASICKTSSHFSAAVNESEIAELITSGTCRGLTRTYPDPEVCICGRPRLIMQKCMGARSTWKSQEGHAVL